MSLHDFTVNHFVFEVFTVRMKLLIILHFKIKVSED